MALDCIWKYLTAQHSTLTELIQFMDHDTRHKDTRSHSYQEHITLHIREKSNCPLKSFNRYPISYGWHTTTAVDIRYLCSPPWKICAEIIPGVFVNQVTDIVAVSVPLHLGGPNVYYSQTREPKSRSTCLPKAPHIRAQCLTCPSVYLLWNSIYNSYTCAMGKNVFNITELLKTEYVYFFH